MAESLRKYGRAPYQVAVIHGGPGAAGEMAPVAVELARTRGVIEPLQTAMSLAGQVEELHDTLRGHATLPVTLVGYSYGAWLCLIVASRWPDSVRRMVLVSCSALDAKYVIRLQQTRLSRMSASEKGIFSALIADLQSPATKNYDTVLRQLGNLATRADAFSLVEEEGSSDLDMLFSGEIYRRVWDEAVKLRSSGELLRTALAVHCPVVAIHGTHDPSPAAGVSEPLATLPNFRMIHLPKSGHTPWKERYARKEFYRLLQEEV